MITSLLIGGTEYLGSLVANKCIIRQGIERDLNVPSSSTLSAELIDRNETLYNALSGLEEYDSGLKIELYWDSALAFEGYIEPDFEYNMNTKILSIKAVDMTKYYADKFAEWDITQLYYTITTEDDARLWGRTYSPNRADFASGTMNVSTFYRVSDLVSRMISDVTGLSSSNIVVVISNSTKFNWKYNSSKYGAINTIKQSIKRKIRHKIIERTILQTLSPYTNWIETADTAEKEEREHSYLGLLNEFAKLTGSIHFYAQGKYYFVHRDYDFSLSITKPASYDLLSNTINGEFSKSKQIGYKGLRIMFDDEEVDYNGTQYLVKDWGTAIGSTDYNGNYIRYTYKQLEGSSPDEYYDIRGFVSTTSTPDFNTDMGVLLEKPIDVNISNPKAYYGVSEDYYEYVDTNEEEYPEERYYKYLLQDLIDAMWENYYNYISRTTTYKVKVNQVDFFPSWIEVDFYKYNILEMKVDLIEETSEFEVRV